MFFRRFLPVLLVLALPACSASVAPLQLTAEHPASPLAAEAPLAAEPSTFAEPSPRPAASAPAPEPMDHSMHGMATETPPAEMPMDHSQHGTAPTHEAADPSAEPAAQPPMDHSAHEAAADDDPPPSDGGS